MRPRISQNHGDLIPTPRHLTLLQGGLSRRLTARQMLDRATKDIAASTKRVDVANSTAYPSRAIAEMAQGTRQPLRIIARIITDELMGGGSVEFGERIGHLIIDFTQRAAAECGRATIASSDDAQRAA